jgi:hypothetical protein
VHLQRGRFLAHYSDRAKKKTKSNQFMPSSDQRSHKTSLSTKKAAFDRHERKRVYKDCQSLPEIAVPAHWAGQKSAKKASR